MHRRTVLKFAAYAAPGLKLTAYAAAGVFVRPSPLLARRPFPADGAVNYKVLRYSQSIGDHRVIFFRDQGRLIVRTDIDIEVGALGVALYRYRHHAEETWEDGWLNGFLSDTDDDGALIRVRAAREDEVFSITTNDRRRTISGYLVPSSLWHRDTPKTEALFDVVEGNLKWVHSSLTGEEDVPVLGKPVRAKRYAIRGELRRNVWYDEDCNLVRVTFPARDGSEITLEPH